MKPYTSGVGRRLKEELLASSSHGFQRTCSKILSLAIPGLRYTAHTKTLDREGVDLYVPSGNDGFERVFQCKGWERSQIEDKDVIEAAASVRKFNSSGIRTKHYYMVVNRYLNGSQRSIFDTALRHLKANGSAELTEIWDVNDLIEFTFGEVSKILQHDLTGSNKTLHKLYADRMEASFYEPAVPFLFKDKNETDPTQWFVDCVLPVIVEETNRRTWTFVISEFGFGKTSFFNALSEGLPQFGVIPIYIPLTQLSTKAFGNEHEFILALLGLLNGESPWDFKLGTLLDEVRHAQLRALLKDNKKIVLLFDGLDEHPMSYKFESLKRLFSCLPTFNATCVFSMRKEFYDERAGTFSALLGKAFRPPIFEINLVEWDDQLIAQFCQRWMASSHGTDGNAGIIEFKGIVERGGYETLYGDIPKRPLFLKMILKDVALGAVGHTSLVELYEKYLQEKFLLDRTGWNDSREVSRPLRLGGDVYEILGFLFKVLTQVARRMVILEKSDSRLIGTCPLPGHLGPGSHDCFQVDLERGRFQCSVCGRSGDVFDFVVLMENLNPRNAEHHRRTMHNLGEDLVRGERRENDRRTVLRIQSIRPHTVSLASTPKCVPPKARFFLEFHVSLSTQGGISVEAF